MLRQSSINNFFIFIAVFSTTYLAIAQEDPQKPNIVFILADDFGYSSLNSYGADKNLLRTPHIDKLADQGMRFTNASTPASICSPTRYGFLTGRYPWRSSLKYGVTHIFSELLPDTNRVTVADWLNDRGYNTAAIGKWHLGYGHAHNESDPNIHTRDIEPLEYAKKVSPGPLDLGFDYHFGVPQNHDDALGVFIENDHIFGIKSDKIHPYSRSFYGQRYIGFDAPQRVNEDVMEVLQSYHQNMGKLVAEYGGTIDHRAGAGLMVFFNDPLPCDHPELKAVDMALAMRELFDELNIAWGKQGYQLGFGIGIASGYATLGIVGYEDRYDYTANGNAVNLASRPCDAAGDGQILFSKKTYIAVEDEVEASKIGEFDLKGISKPVVVYDLKHRI